ncbi:hypothetical protein F4826_004793 [Rahnella inusitata]|nr:hypothetical protein [Rahnella inusitata]
MDAKSALNLKAGKKCGNWVRFAINHVLLAPGTVVLLTLTLTTPAKTLELTLNEGVLPSVTPSEMVKMGSIEQAMTSPVKLSKQTASDLNIDSGFKDLALQDARQYIDAQDLISAETKDPMLRYLDEINTASPIESLPNGANTYRHVYEEEKSTINYGFLQIWIMLALISSVVALLIRSSTEEVVPELKKEEPKRGPGDSNISFVKPKRPDRITGKSLSMAMVQAHYDAVYSGFLKSLERAGYMLSDDAKAQDTLLPGSIFYEIAREVERARQDDLISMGHDVEAHISSHMVSGYSQRFLSQLITSCSKLGWKVVPRISLSGDVCEKS